MTPVEQRFWAKVDKSGGPDACWEWTAARYCTNYGAFRTPGPRRRTVTATRFYFEMLNGEPLPRHLDVCHTCDNPPCVNPAHLFVGTRGDNVQDMLAKGRAPYQQITSCPRGHPRTAEHGKWHKRSRGWREWRCSTCSREKYAERQAAS